MILSYQKFHPKIHPRSFIAPNASVIGRVEIQRGASIWFGAVLRADINRIVVGKRSNVQDNCVLHVEDERACILKDGVIMGHQATAHGCTVGNGALIGIGARILNGAVLGDFCIIGAGAIVLEKTKIPPYTLAVGVPAKPVRKLTPKEVTANRKAALKYERLGLWYQENILEITGAGTPLIPIHDLSKIF